MTESRANMISIGSLAGVTAWLFGRELFGREDDAPPAGRYPGNVHHARQASEKEELGKQRRGRKIEG